ncbi:DNA-binding transcriptional regulator, MarR family [Asanoa hainanensis]|uniref:DNA-binding transcriptional regulator, MarR family n=1 Tax=Asanoa hainanensis TaxID=560556 RepID=A0A239N9N9_9ACTN|nr:MarR family transcriptional regulator [Asanoa hainanensis]SNT51470.1 DNA-binding transcriptional regulator, MarR family [Asanoa hainanensis]
MNAEDSVIGRIETEVALLMRFAEATRRATPVEAHRSLDRAAYVILRHLDEAGPQNVSALAARLNLDGSTVTRQVGAMEREGLIAREADPSDGRGTLVSATPSGLRRMAVVRAARAEIYDEMLAAWTETDRSDLATLLTRLNEALALRSQARRRL